jgi:hypothetical protein
VGTSYVQAAGTRTNAAGFYIFNNLGAGTYEIIEIPPSGFRQGVTSVGTVSGINDGSVVPGPAIGNIVLKAGQVGVGFDFALLPSKAFYI